MSALLRAELLKLRTTRTFAALVGSALALSLLAVTLAAALTDHFTEDEVKRAVHGRLHQPLHHAAGRDGDGG